MSGPRCQIGDLVRVERGPCADRFGTVLCEGDPFLIRLTGEVVWLVEFPSPVPCWSMPQLQAHREIQARLVNCSDSNLEPYRPDAVPLDQSVVQPLANPLTTAPEAA